MVFGTNAYRFVLLLLTRVLLSYCGFHLINNFVKYRDQISLPVPPNMYVANKRQTIGPNKYRTFMRLNF